MATVITNSEQIRQTDRRMVEDFAYPSLLLMEAAGRKSTEIILSEFPNINHFIILCGLGNNGGDGLAIARYLHQNGIKVDIIFPENPERIQGDARINYEIIRKLKLPIHIFDQDVSSLSLNLSTENTLIIDALVGTGLKDKLNPTVASLIQYFRSKPNSVIAIDIPSGLSADTGSIPNNPLKAIMTIAFHAPKICHYVTPASKFCGDVRVVDIGIYPQINDELNIKTFLIDNDIIKKWHIKPELDAHKGTFGHVILAGGSRGMAGSIALATQSALEIGAGLTTAFIPASIACAFHRNTLENMSIPYGTNNVHHLNGTAAEVFGSFLQGKASVVIGPGLGVHEDTKDFLMQALPYIKQPLVLDADALNLIAEYPDLWERIPHGSIITPHPGEMARLLKSQQVQEKRLETALSVAHEKQVIVVLKGAGTIVATPEGNAWVCKIANPAMATAGSGDVLAGCIAGLLARGYEPEKAAVMGVYLHAYSGEIASKYYGGEGVTALKIMKNLSIALKQILES
ncbi:MAG: NAD(P)H-hydrate dehydratase [Bacteroidia bacterium]|nr:NAD(P)H-hydrate dehydratase [Bacteroidia bacterium]